MTARRQEEELEVEEALRREREEAQADEPWFVQALDVLKATLAEEDDSP